MSMKKRLDKLETNLNGESAHRLLPVVEVVVDSREQVKRAGALPDVVTFRLPAGKELPKFMEFSEFIESIEVTDA